MCKTDKGGLRHFAARFRYHWPLRTGILYQQPALSLWNAGIAVGGISSLGEKNFFINLGGQFLAGVITGFAGAGGANQGAKNFG